MYALIALFALSLFLCLVLTPLCRNLSLKFRLVDVPDRARRIHTREIPRIGGVPIVLAYIGALAIMLVFAPSQARIVIRHEKLLYALLPATGIVFLTGLIDDLAGLKPWQKLFCQFIGATWAVLAAHASLFSTASLIRLCSPFHSASVGSSPARTRSISLMAWMAWHPVSEFLQR